MARGTVLLPTVAEVTRDQSHNHPYAIVPAASELKVYVGLLVRAATGVTCVITAAAFATHIGDDINSRLTMVIADMDFLNIEDDNIFVLIENVHNEINIILFKMQKMTTLLKIK
jgi:hypothetical protein